MRKRHMKLQFFADGGEGESAANAEGTAQAVETNANAGAEQETGDQWETLINGQYKSQFDAAVKARTEKAIKERFKSANAAKEQATALQKQLDDLAPVMEALASKYNLAENDFNGIIGAVSGDDSYYEDEAYRNNSSVEQVKINRKKDRALKDKDATIEKLKEGIEKRRAQDERATQLDGWASQSAQVREAYPDYDFEYEFFKAPTGKQFYTLLTAGFDAKSAYEAVHHAELQEAAVKKAMEDARAATAASIRANGMRPTENGLNEQAPATSGKPDINNLSYEQIIDLFNRSARGERITLK